MKKHFLLLFPSLLFLSSVFAQNRKIEFVSGDFSSALAKAKAENKMVFMDCYTTWCGPCKMLSSQIFTQDAVGDYFNTHFVSVKMDMEKGEGVALQQKYGVKAYPTLLFINPDSEEMHRTLGFMPAEKLIDEAKTARDPKFCSACIEKAIKSGNRSPEMILAYFKGKQTRQELQAAESEAFLATLSDADFTSKAYWTLIFNFVGNANTVSGKRLMALRNNFAKTTTSDSLEMKIATTYNLTELLPRQQTSDPQILLQTIQDLRKQASQVSFKNPKIAQDMLDTYDIELLQLTKNGKAFCETIERSFKSIFTGQDPDMQWRMRLFRMQTSEQFVDNEVAAFAEKWAREAYTLKPTEFYSNYFLGKALNRTGKADEASTVLEKALEIGKKENADTREVEAILGKLKYAKDQIIMGYTVEERYVTFEFDPKLYASLSNSKTGLFTPLKDFAIESVNVAGDFNEWDPKNRDWKMTFNKKTQTYQLKVAISSDKRTGKISLAPNKTHIFKFVVNNDEWVMPTEKTKNITLEPGKDFSYSNMTLEVVKPQQLNKN